jgi:cobalt-zinc-cadmium efflux system membrane fusion protein
MKKKSIIIFAAFVFIALFITAFGMRHAGISEAIAGKDCGVQHKEDVGQDSHEHQACGQAERTPDLVQHDEHDGHDHEKKADGHTTNPDEKNKKSDYDGNKPDALKHEDHKGHKHDTHAHSVEGSDLDRPVDDLWAAQCEHNILHYTCDECRYELGVVKLSDKVFKSKDNQGLVSVAPVGRQDFSKPLQLTGEVVMNESRTVRVSSPLQGTIARLVADLGQTVEQGALLVELDSIDAAEAKGDFLKKAAALTLARTAAEREAALFAKKISAEAEVLEANNRQTEAEIELANARARLARLGFSEKDINGIAARSAGNLTGILPLYAPRSGRVLERYGSIGERVEAGKEMLLLSDLSEVWVWADIRETDLHLLPGSGGFACEVDMPGSAGKKYSGTLEAVTGIMNEQTRTVRARISVSNMDGQLRPGMFVNVRVLLQGRENAVAVPQVALLTDGGRDFVFVHKEGEYWIRRPVEKGESFGQYVTIRGGLSEGQKIIADGSFLLKSDVLRSKMGAGCAD